MINIIWRVFSYYIAFMFQDTFINHIRDCRNTYQKVYHPNCFHTLHFTIKLQPNTLKSIFLNNLLLTSLNPCLSDPSVSPS